MPCIRWRGDRVLWNGPIVNGAQFDPVIQHGLSSRIKYVRLVKREVCGHARYYAQLICEGMSYQKPEHTIGNETIGLDIGPSTMAQEPDLPRTIDRRVNAAINTLHNGIEI